MLTFATENITENSAAPLIGDFLRQFKTVECDLCSFHCVLRFHNGKAQFYITELKLNCYDHVRLFNETLTISTPSCSASLCSRQSCLKFLRSLHCVCTENQVSNCKHLKTIECGQFGHGVCELMDQVPNPSTCSLSFHGDHFMKRFWGSYPSCSMALVEAEELAGVLPRFNVTALRLGYQRLESVRRTLTAAAAFGQSLSEMSSLGNFQLIGVDGSLLQAEENGGTVWRNQQNGHLYKILLFVIST